MFSMRKFLTAHWTDKDKLHGWIRAYGIEPPSRAAVHKWLERNSVPAEWFATLLILLEMENGAPISLIAYRA